MRAARDRSGRRQNRGAPVRERTPARCPRRRSRRVFEDRGPRLRGVTDVLRMMQYVCSFFLMSTASPPRRTRPLDHERAVARREHGARRVERRAARASRRARRTRRSPSRRAECRTRKPNAAGAFAATSRARDSVRFQRERIRRRVDDDASATRRRRDSAPSRATSAVPLRRPPVEHRLRERVFAAARAASSGSACARACAPVRVVLEPRDRAGSAAPRYDCVAPDASTPVTTIASPERRARAVGSEA